MRSSRRSTSVEARALRLDAGELAYVLKRSPRRRTLGLRIDGKGLTVNAPARAPQHWVESVLRDKAGWVFTKLREQQQQQAPQVRWQDGELLPFMGGHIRLDVAVGPVRAPALLSGEWLQVRLADPLDEKALQVKVMKWYRAQAQACFVERVEIYAARLGVPLPPLRLSNARTCWGRCNARGEISLNWRLVKAPLQTIDYVVAHELAHIKHLNHSPAFWALVGQLFPGHLQVRAALKTEGWRYHGF
jgi:predicted metal-dependent hydrolase